MPFGIHSISSRHRFEDWLRRTASCSKQEKLLHVRVDFSHTMGSFHRTCKVPTLNLLLRPYANLAYLFHGWTLVMHG